ncbi:PH domain-containing protein [Laceyella putida]|uniref:PH domain-containing protein n=1 Tax=Laceyella putida TaxID=110101 RepID=A0ABW2RFZ0_9BACL
MSAFLYPRPRWRYLVYEVTEKELFIGKGFFFTKETFIPMSRIQHVQSKQGPLLRSCQLSNVEVFTAGGDSFVIPAIDQGEAERLRKKIIEWVRVEEHE